MHADGHASLYWGVPVPYVVNETKLRIIAVMEELDRPVSAAELYAAWDGSKKLSVFDYHLSSLVRAGIAEIVSGPELSFSLITAAKRFRI